MKVDTMRTLPEINSSPSNWDLHSRLAPTFETEAITIANLAGKKIAAYLDIPSANGRFKGVAIIAPAYGETKENNLLMAAYLAANQYGALRFDWTDHVGESDGDVFTCTLSKMERDLKAVVHYTRQRFQGYPLGIVASSLAARVGLKTAMGDSGLGFLICFTPVINLQETLAAVYREDLVNAWTKGKRYGTLNILGFSIDADNFLSDSIKYSFADLSSTCIDANKVRVATLFVVGKRDPWVRTSDAQRVFEMIDSSNKKIAVLPAMLHRLLENPTVAKPAFTETIRFIVGATERCPPSFRVGIAEPNEDEIRARELFEKEHLKKIYAYSKADERDFWKEYLGNFKYIINIHDFYNLLECVYKQLGGAFPGQKILDAGCGIGNYGLFLLMKQFYRAQQDIQTRSQAPIRYFGIDFVASAISEAKLRLAQMLDHYKLNSRPKPNYHFLESRFILADLDSGIPFPSGFFDQIGCNLVLSYVQNPTFVLKEFWRVSRRGGKMVVTSLKPGADLSEVYRNFISVAENSRDLEEGRKLLSNAGLIKIKETRGLYHFYTDKELREAVREAGFSRPRTLRSFGDQVNVLACTKI